MRSNRTFAALLLSVVSLGSTGFALVSPVARQNDSVWDRAVSTAAGVTISGRVKTANNRSIKGAVIQLKDAETNQVVRTAVSSNFGYYKIENVDSSRSYVVSIKHKSYIFVLPAHLLEFSEDRVNFDFVGEAAE